MSLTHVSSGLTADGRPAAFDGRMPAAPGDLTVEAHGIEPVPESNRYGRAGRLFTVWFAPNLTMTGVFTGTVGIALGLDFATALAAVVLGTLVGAVPTAYLGTWGSQTGAGQLPLAAAGVRPSRRAARGPAVAVLRRLGRADRPVRRGRAGPAVRLAVLARRARGHAGRQGVARCLRLRGDPPPADGHDVRARRRVRADRLATAGRRATPCHGLRARCGPRRRFRPDQHHRAESVPVLGPVRQ